MSSLEEKNINRRLNSMMVEIKEIKNYLKSKKNNATVSSSEWGNVPQTNNNGWSNVPQTNNNGWDKPMTTNEMNKLYIKAEAESKINRNNELRRQAEFNVAEAEFNSPYNNKKTYRNIKVGDIFNYHSSKDNKNYKNLEVTETYPLKNGRVIRTTVSRSP